MSGIRSGVLGGLLLLAACGGQAGPKLPVATFLSPEGANHITSRFSPDGRKVAYWSPGADGWDAILANADLSSPRTISSHNTRTWEFVWSPDSRQLAIAASATNVADIVIFPADSGAGKQLTSAPGFEVPMAWSPRGDRLTYSATGEGGAAVAFFLDLGTGQSSPVPTTAPVPRPVYSPDGSRLAIDGFGARPGKIWVADSMGNGEKPVTSEGLESRRAGLPTAPKSPMSPAAPDEAISGWSRSTETRRVSSPTTSGKTILRGGHPTGSGSPSSPSGDSRPISGWFRPPAAPRSG